MKSKLLIWPMSGLALMGAGVLIANTATPAGAHTVIAAPQPAVGPDSDAACGADPCGEKKMAGHPAPLSVFSRDKWGIIGRNTLGSPNAVLRRGPYGRTTPSFAATQAPPYGRGSLGIIVGSETDKIAFGNESIFAGERLSSIERLRYWIFAGVGSLSGVILPSIAIEVDPNVGSSNYTSLVYLPSSSAGPSAPSTPVPNVWQRYDASETGSRWFATGVTGTEIGCTQAAPCSFADLKAKLPDALISYSLGISKGGDTPFVGAVDGLQVNDTVYDFEFSGVRPRPVY